MEKSQTKFLSNTPLGKDLFTGKPQEKISDTLCDILSRDNFQVIGIDGSWGTGKSNLVSILREKLKTKKYYFFIYDVWGHQEDDQRRAILEELTDFIVGEEGNIVLNKNKWKENLKNLLAKTKTTKTTSQPVISVGIILSALIIVLTPLFNSISSFIENDYLKILISIVPILILLIVYFIFYNKEKSSKKALMKMFEIYEKEKYDITLYEKISEDEPSVKMFRNWMCEIDNDLGDSKLVLVFDNFDRLPKEDILNLWSSIHVFFAEKKYKNIKVIIPFDRQHIKNAFSELDNSKDTFNLINTGKQNNYSEDYINKTFDIIYRVSPPILSNWKNYFKDKWIEAFGHSESEEYERVVQLYEIFNDTITPREVIVFINEIVSLKLLFNGKIPEQYFAIFILNKNILLSNPLKEITEPTYLAGASYLYKNDENLPKFLTSIIYQIDPDDAIDVIYTKQLKSALINKEFDTFKNISNSKIFQDTIFRVLDEIENIEYPIETLDTGDFQDQISSHVIKLVWQRLFDKALEYNFQELQIRPYQKILLRRLEKEQKPGWLHHLINDLYSKDQFNAETFSNIIDEIDIYIKENNIDLNVFEYLKQKEVIVELFVPFVSTKLSDHKKYKISCEERMLNKYLSELDIEKLSEVRYLTCIKDSYSLTYFSKIIKEKIEIYKSDKDNLSILFNIYKEINNKPIEILLTDQEVYNLFNQSSNNDDFYYDLISMRLARQISFNPSYVSVFSSVLNTYVEETVLKIVERIEYYINYDEFLIGSKNFLSSPLYLGVAKNIILQSFGSSRGEIRSLLMNFEDICNNIEIEPKILLKDLNRWKYDDPKQNDVEEFPNLLYKTSIETDTELGSKLIANANEYFKELTKDSWVDVFDNLNSKLFELAKIISYNNWNSHSTDALLDSFVKLIYDGNFINRNDWEYLFNSYKSKNIPLINFFKSIRDRIYNDRDFVKKDFFSFLLNSFEENDILTEKPGDSFRTFFKNDFLDDDETIRNMIEKHEYMKKLMQRSKDHEISDFIEGIKDRYNQSDLIKFLAQKLEIYPRLESQ